MHELKAFRYHEMHKIHLHCLKKILLFFILVYLLVKKNY